MDSMIKEINDNLRIIVDSIKINNDELEGQIDSIQSQMDKKVDEAKKYKVEVDECKRIIKKLEEDNESLELSLEELCDKFSKLDMVSLVETGKKEINSKINNNVREINKQKEQISELTEKAKTIKDLLLNLKKDKMVKTERLENNTILYQYYNDRISEVIDYAFDHSLNLKDYVNNKEDEDVKEIDNVDLENTMLFNEIVDIDKQNKDIKKEFDFSNLTDNNENNIELNNPSETTQVFDTIFNNDKTTEKNIEEENNEKTDDNIIELDSIINDVQSDSQEVSVNIEESNIDDNNNSNNDVNFDFNKLVQESEKQDAVELTKNEIDDEEDNRINKINNLFENFNAVNNANPFVGEKIETEIDNAYKDIFGEELKEEKEVNETTFTDIFGNPITNDELNNSVKEVSDIENLFTKYGLDFNKFKDNQKDYLRQIYNEDKFIKIFDVLNKYNIDLNNIYYSYNILGEVTDVELNNILNILTTAGQNSETIGLILEKMTKIKKYNLEEAINDLKSENQVLDITELIMKAKELYKVGGSI